MVSSVFVCFRFFNALEYSNNVCKLLFTFESLLRIIEVFEIIPLTLNCSCSLIDIFNCGTKSLKILVLIFVFDLITYHHQYWLHNCFLNLI